MKPDFTIAPERTPEPRTDRKPFTKKQRAEAFMRASGRCEVCAKKLTGAYQIDHIIALDHTGLHIPSNWRVLCVDCHKPKTAADAAISAHINRIHEKHGFKERKARPTRAIPPHANPWPKRKFNGSVAPKASARVRAEGA